MSAGQVAAAVRGGEVSAAEVVSAHLAAFEAAGELGVAITLCADQAMDRAARRPDGPLAGVPVAVKDLFDTAGVRTTYGSKVYADWVPNRTAPVVERLEAAGAIVVAKVNLHEFAWGLTSQNVHWGDVHNPLHPDRTPGGSSGGSAAALAANLAPLALGTDTGGSIRVPAACCGVVGFKPSHGALPMDGVFPLAPTLDTAGPMARTVEDCLLAWSVLTGTRVPEPAFAGLRVGLAEDAPYAGLVEELGGRPVAAGLPGRPGELSPVFFYEACATHAATYPSRREEYGPSLRAKFDAAAGVGEAAYRAAREAMLDWRARCRAEPGADIYLLPVLGSPLPARDVDERSIREVFGGAARPVNELGWAGLAIGNLQIVGPDDAVVLAAGRVLAEPLAERPELTAARIA